MTDLAAAIEGHLLDTEVRPPSQGGCWTKAQRRALLDAAAWVRDVLYTIIGHTNACVFVRSRKRRHSDPKPAPRVAVDRYKAIKRKAPGAAERYLASQLSPASQVTIALIDPDDGHPLSPVEMVGNVTRDIKARAQNDFHQDEQAKKRFDEVVHRLKSKGAHPDSIDMVQSQSSLNDRPPDTGPYTMEELDAVLHDLDPNKATVRGCYAALRATCEAGKRLTLALMNLGRHVAMTSSLWATRRCQPIRKSGPRLVRKISCLRPVSLCCDLARVQDSLWLWRWFGTLMSFCGSDQVGGVSDPISPLLALVLHAQLRRQQGLQTIWAATDQQWAFDVANVQVMLCAAFVAGITGVDWLLLCDFLMHDQVRVQIAGVLSAAFSLQAGTGQGRPFSGAIFCGQVSLLRDEIAKSLRGGTCALIPQRVRAALHAASSMVLPKDPRVEHDYERLTGQLRAALQTVGVTWEQALGNQECLASIFASIDFHSDRALLAESCGSERLGAVQFSDDTTTPCACPGATAAVVRRHPASACSRYAVMTKSAFHYGDDKSAVLPLFAEEPLDEVYLGCRSVLRKRILGVLFDALLTFQPLLAEVVAMAWSSMRALMQAAQSGGFSLPLAMEQVVTRIVPMVCYPAAFLVCADGAIEALNRLQLGWARALLGLPMFAEVRHALLLLQCNWPFRLGTRVVEEAIMALARLRVSPPCSPGTRLLLLAEEIGGQSWLSTIWELMDGYAPGMPVREVHRCGLFSDHEMAAAAENRDARRMLLRRYRLQAVRPALADSDARYFASTTNRVLEGWGCPYSNFQTELQLWKHGMRDLDLGRQPWLRFRCWAVVKCTGKWPLRIFDLEGLPAVMDFCPLCQAREVGVRHVLLECVETAPVYDEFFATVQVAPRAQAAQLLYNLFAEPAEPHERALHMFYVSTCFARCVARAAVLAAPAS